MTFRKVGAVVALSVAMVAPATMGHAQTGLQVVTRDIDFIAGGRTQVTVSVAGHDIGAALPVEAFTVSENGRPVSDFQVERLLSGASRVDAVLAIDTSGSTRGQGLVDAKSAAQAFVAGLPGNVQIGLLTFGSEVRPLSQPTSDRNAIQAAIDAMEAGGASLLHDGVIAASQMLVANAADQRNLIVISDGENDSAAPLGQVETEIRNAGAVVTAVALATNTVEEDRLQRLVDARDGGTLIQAGDFTGLSAALTQAAQAIASQYVITYPSADTTSTEVNVRVRVAIDGLADEDGVVTLNQRRSAPQGLQPATAKKPLIPALGSQAGLLIGLGAVFLAIVLIGVFVVVPAPSKEAERVLARGLRPYAATERKKRKSRGRRGDGGILSQSSLGRQAMDLLERVPRSKSFDERMQKLLEQAGWPLRATEFVAIQIGSVVAGAILGLGLFRWPGALFMMVMGALFPRAFLNYKIKKREAAFLAQLPETLGLLAGSLQAGYGFMQAVDTVAKESSPPISVEFGRVMVEARLGMPIEDSLDRMAERVGGVDFKWVVLAINIQRQVGGNLATLLHTVADTLREREMVRRQIKTLSAEGRMSAYVLVALPFFVAFYLMSVQPDYLKPLFGSGLGKALVAVSLVLMGVGIAWMRKIVNIDV